MTKNNETLDKFTLGSLGHSLKIMFSGSAVKWILWTFIIIVTVLLIFSFFIDPLISFIVFLCISVFVILYFSFLLPKRPELFQDSKTWLAHERMLFGSKATGLFEILPDTPLYQPTSTSPAKISSRVANKASK